MGTSAGCCIPIIQQKKISNSPAGDTPSFTFSFRVNTLGGSGTYRAVVLISWCEDTGGSCLTEDDTLIEVACSSTCSANGTRTHDISVPGSFNVISQGWNKVTYSNFYDQENTYFKGQGVGPLNEFFSVGLRTWGTTQVDYDYVQFGAIQLVTPDQTVTTSPSPYGYNPIVYPCNNFPACGQVTSPALQGAALRAPNVDSLPFIYLFIVLFLLTLGPYLIFRRERKTRQYDIRL